MIIREMTNEDAPDAAAIEQTLGGSPWSAESFRGSLDRPEAHFLVAEAPDGSLAAYCGCYKTPDDAEIVSVACAENYRRQGYASALLDRMIRDLADDRILRIVLEVRAGNEAAICLYRRFGFKEIGVRRRFYENPPEDALVMQRG